MTKCGPCSLDKVTPDTMIWWLKSLCIHSDIVSVFQGPATSHINKSQEVGTMQRRTCDDLGSLLFKDRQNLLFSSNYGVLD
jgi:hypothetical protein